MVLEDFATSGLGGFQSFADNRLLFNFLSASVFRLQLLMSEPTRWNKLKLILAVISVAGATVIPTYLSGALTVALPSIGPRIGLTGQNLQWPLSLFSLVNGAFLLLTGGLADVMGRRAVFLLGNAWMVVFLVPLAFTHKAGSFIALHGVLGLGAAMLSPSATGILSESLPDGSFKNGAFAALGAGQPLGESTTTGVSRLTP
jgi:MFS family permease